ncbi:hypothetical protein CC2G_000542 [Coprinopsis cinerea AmutBmut pab1-1]|nr:hypothetical protein CC2G_000542 [Coprinopsis cinerea AmutBmut pab1-1]
MESTPSRGVAVNIATFLLSSVGLALSIFTALVDAFLGHNAVAHLLYFFTGRPPVDHHDLATLQDHASLHKRAHNDQLMLPRRSLSPSPEGKIQRRHHRHHSHHRRHQNPTGILLNSSESDVSYGSSSMYNTTRSSSTTATFPRASSHIRPRSPIPTITVHTPEQHGSQFSPTPTSPRKPSSSRASISKGKNPDPSSPTPHVQIRQTIYLHQGDPSPRSIPEPSRTRAHMSSGSSESDTSSSSLRERTPSITFAHPDRPAKEQKSRSSNRLALPPLGTSPAQFRQGHRRGLSRCSSSPQLSTPPATPVDIYEQKAASTTSLLTPSSAETIHIQRQRRKSTGEADIPSPTKLSMTVPCLPPMPKQKDESKTKTLGKLLRRVPSAPGPLLPNPDKLEQTTKKAFMFSFNTSTKPREVKPKRSMTSLTPPKKLRRQPYEAPFFCPTPDSAIKSQAGESNKTRSAPASRASSPELRQDASSQSLTRVTVQITP